MAPTPPKARAPIAALPNPPEEIEVPFSTNS